MDSRRLIKQVVGTLATGACVWLLAACKSTGEPKPKVDKATQEILKAQKKAQKSAGPVAAAVDPSVDVEFLLGMSFEEASAISAGSGGVSGVAHVAADKVEVVKRTADGSPRRVRAEGHVFVQLDSGGGEVATALSREVYISEDEVILRGKPVLRRGVAVLEGLSNSTVFFVVGNQVRAIGNHRVRNGLAQLRTPEASAMLANMRRDAPPPAAGAMPQPKLPEIGPWQDGPSLLPPLDDSAVPAEIREELRRQMEAEAVLQNARQQPPGN